MGVAVIFGLTFATALTLIVVPVMISLIWRLTGAPAVETSTQGASEANG